MDLSFNINFWGLLGLFIICGCVYEIISDIASKIMITRSMKYLEKIPDDQREKILNAITKDNSKKNGKKTK